MTDLEILEATRALLAEPESWTIGANARSKDGYEIGPQSPNATCWCLVGALIKVTGDNVPGSIIGKLSSFTVFPIQFINDTSTHSEVLLLLDSCIAKESSND